MKAVIITDNGVQDEEFFYPYYRLQEEHFQVDVVTRSQSLEVCRGKYGIPITPTIRPSETDTRRYDLVVVPGGWEAPERLRQEGWVLRFIAYMNKERKVIAAICHGPAVLISAGVVKGKQMTCYKGMKDDLVNAGALYRDVGVVRDDNIITSPHYRNPPDFMRETLAECGRRYQLGSLVLA